MKYLIYLLFISLFLETLSAQSVPKVLSGKIERIENMQSQNIDSRNIDIWLPNGYNSKKKYAVLYMHDGQMLFDSSITWNKKSWDVDQVIEKLINKNQVVDFIVVGIWNRDQSRHADYFPQKPFEALSDLQKETVLNAARINGKSIFGENKIQSDKYLKFIVEELKPIIDKKYNTYKDVAHTFIAGSSMGGLISFYAICEYPEVFGGAACLSTHWPGIFTLNDNPIPNAFIQYMKSHLPSSKDHKIYFDYGDRTLDALYPPLQKKVDAVMLEKGFNEKSWITNFFPGDDHSENAWKNRLDKPLLFLLGSKQF